MARRSSSSSWNYLYERLGEKRFQQLCSALLKRQFPDVTCYPVGQRDGGRDIARRSSDGFIIYQVKWTNDRLQSPVSWLNKAITGEADNIKRLVTEGAGEYLLMTSVSGTSVPGRGTMDALERKLAEHSRVFGIPMRCEWQADIDARVDSAPKELKFAYGEMLVGFDLVRYLIEADRLEAREEALRSLLLKVIATQWDRDEKVKFKQVELDSHKLVDLFVDVEARLISSASPMGANPLLLRTVQFTPDDAEGKIVGGAAQYLLREQGPLTLIRGEPGQGKSTLGQFLCQLHRAAYLGHEPFTGEKDQFKVSDPRLPLRIDLEDYAAWVDGQHPYSTSDSPPTTRGRKPRNSSLESFLAYLLHSQSGGLTATVETVNEILNRFPLLIVLDGLDEVAQPSLRRQAVTEINAFAVRLAVDQACPQLIVTTRPNASGLPEPSTDQFSVLALVGLSPALRTAYLRKWANARSIHGTERRTLQHTFDERSAEPHIAPLTQNPMHLTIVLYLMYKRGESVPSKRTELYQSYMETFLDRETEKNAIVKTHRTDLEEVTAFLGWHMHSTTESQGAIARMPVQAIKKAINGHLFDIGNRSSSVDELFTGVTDRVWALASKVQGTFEFDVQPVQEYFAAKYLYESANAASDSGKSALLGHLLRRPFWLNTARFYAGFANTNELPALLEGLQEQIECGDHPGQIRQAVWLLLADGVFARRPRTQRNTAALLRDNLSVQLLTYALEADDELIMLPADRGAVDLVDMLRDDVVADPAGPLSKERMRLAHWLQPDRDSFYAWWQPHIDEALGTSNEMAWLQAAIPWQGGRRLSTEQAGRLALSEAHAPGVALAAGITATPDSPTERRLIAAVVDGLCSEQARELVNGFAGDLLKALDPQHFLAMAHGVDPAVHMKHPRQTPRVTPAQRTAAWRRLRDRDPRFEQVQVACQFSRGQKGTTSPWGNTARAIAAIFGPCWLAAEIAIIGAATLSSMHTTGGDLTKDSRPFGADPDYGRLLQVLRTRPGTDWWQRQLTTYDDPLSHSVWAFALLAVANSTVVHDCLTELDTVVCALSPPLASALVQSSSRFALAAIGRRLTTQILADTAQLSALTSLLIAHHEDVADPNRLRDLPLTNQRLKAMAGYGIAAWPVHRALTVRAADEPTPEYLDALRALGPAYLGDGGTRGGYAAHKSAAIHARLPLEIKKIILGSPELYPRSWIHVADMQTPHRDEVPDLERVAQSEGWFNF
jgi:hypothetical protein